VALIDHGNVGGDRITRVDVGAKIVPGDTRRFLDGEDVTWIELATICQHLGNRLLANAYQTRKRGL
jgi:hypothetical protein